MTFGVPGGKRELGLGVEGTLVRHMPASRQGKFLLPCIKVVDLPILNDRGRFY